MCMYILCVYIYMKHKYEICMTSDPMISFLCLYPKKYKHKEIHTKKT